MELEELTKLVPEGETLFTIGVFDGVHVGHQHLLRELISQAAKRNLASGVITFPQHPQAVLSPRARLPYLTSFEERTALLRGMGIERIVALSFTTRLAQLTARQFVMLLKKHLGMRGLVIGPDFALGREREGDAARLLTLGEELGFTVDVVPPLVLEGRVVSSTAIREVLGQGDMTTAARLLGRYFSLKSTVTKGDERGKTLGFPTANLALNQNQALPANGIYVTRAYIEDEIKKSVTNIGTRPTFGPGPKMVEVHILDFDGDLYGQELKIELVERIRPETRFPSIDALKAQIAKDVARARAVLQ